MDYAKYAYIKTTELELQNSVSSSSATSATNAIEFVSGVLNISVTNSSDITCGDVLLLGNAYFQNKLIIEAFTEGSICLEMLIDGVSILTENRNLSVGENQIILMKTYNPLAIQSVTVSIRIKIITESFACKVLSNLLAVWGNVSQTNNHSMVQMRVLGYDDSVLISYSENNNIYLSTTPIEEKSLTTSDFSLVASGISHCFAIDKLNDLYFFRVDASGNLFYSKYSQVLNETKIDENVSVVFARKCLDIYSEDILICYIKNGQPLFKCLSNGVVGSSNSFTLPSGKYTDIEIIDAPDAERMFVVCTHENQSNYIVHTVKEESISTFTEYINASLAVKYNRYVKYLKDGEDSTLEYLKADLQFNANRVFINSEDFLENKIVESINAKIEYSPATYVVDNSEINYVLSYNQLETYVAGEHRVKYSEDCAGWTPAYFNFDDGSLVDESGILEKWPFNQIKPCLVSKGKILGYLNPNDYSLFVDGTEADITNTEYDVMVEFPKIYYKIEHEWDNVCAIANCTLSNMKVSICNKPKDGYVCYSHIKQAQEYDSIYISAYENVYRNTIGTILCCSNIYTSNDNNHQESLEIVEDVKGSQYTTFTYHVSTYLQILTLLLFAEYNGKKTTGAGYKTSLGDSYTGVCNQKGMFYGVSANGDVHSKFFGLENLFGGKLLNVDGLLTDDNLHFFIFDPTNPDCKINFDAENYIEVAFEGITNTYPSYLHHMAGDTSFGFLPIGHHNLITKATPYYYCQTTVRKPSQYASAVGAYYRNNMTYSSFGGYNSSYPSIFSYTAVYQSMEINFCAERLVCYPENKMS